MEAMSAVVSDDDRFEVMSVDNAKKALKVLERYHLDVVVADMANSDAGALAWLEQVRLAQPAVIVMPVVESNSYLDLASFRGMKRLRKPLSDQKIAAEITEALAKESKIAISGTHIGYFLQFVSSDNKTCAVTVKSEGSIGVLYFDKGNLVDATAPGLEGEEAAINIMAWEDEPDMQLRSLYLSPKPTISVSLDSIVMESVMLKDSGQVAIHKVVERFDGIYDSEELRVFLGNLEWVDSLVVLDRNGRFVTQSGGGDKIAPLAAFTIKQAYKLGANLRWGSTRMLTITHASGDRVAMMIGKELAVGMVVNRKKFTRAGPKSVWPVVRDAII